MLSARILPCLLLQNSGLYKTQQFKNPVYVGDPINAVKIYNEKEVDELVFLDISASPQKRGPQFELIARIAREAFMPFSYGGGVRSLDEMRQLFSLGVEKVILNTYVAENPSFIEAAAKEFGSQSVVISIDVKTNFWGKKEVYYLSGSQSIKTDPVSYAKKVQELGAGEILVNSIDRDGTMKGFDLELISEVAKNTDLPVIACGGAGSNEDLHRAIHQAGASAVAAGSLFVFHGKHKAVLINYPNQEQIKKILAES
jgi:cyclase